MSIRKISSMDEKEYLSFLYKFIDDYNMSMTEATTSDDHAKAFHSNLSDERLLDRCKNEHRNSSQFICQKQGHDVLDMNYYVSETLYSEARKISDWMTDNRTDHTLVINVDFGETVGYGYEKNTLLKKDSPRIKMCLRKSYEPECQLGFYIETAFPDIAHDESRYVGQLEMDPYKDGRLITGNSLEEIKEIKTKEEFLNEITHGTDARNTKEIELAIPDDYFTNVSAQEKLIHDFAAIYGLDESHITVSAEDPAFLMLNDTPVAMTSDNSLFICHENIAAITQEEFGLDAQPDLKNTDMEDLDVG